MRKLRPAGERRRVRTIVLATLIPLAVLALVAAAIGWYVWALRPLDSADANHVRVTVASGTLAPEIGRQLQRAKLIRSATAFELYARLSGNENKLRSGTYAFAPDEPVKAIVSDLVTGKTDQFTITITPGQTLQNITDTLKGYGYSASDINAAMNAAYDDPLLSIRGSQTSLEGLLYPDTYDVLSDEPLTAVFGRIFTHFDSVIADNGLQAGFAAHGLSLYQGITLASIVQREVSGPEDQKNVASVFYNRLDADMVLGSEVTYVYGASLLGVTPVPDLDSPYNLYVNKGLTPTPIGSPGLSALQAVANPAQTDYLYFLSGDDGKTYFAQTDTQHEQNIKDHCQLKCQ